MQLYSTENTTTRVDFEQAVFQSLPPDNGLYMPVKIPVLDEKFIREIDQYSLSEIAFRVSRHLLQGAIDDVTLQQIVHEAANFPAPVVELENNVYVLELFHGPSLAFKDFGARFMSRVMAYFLKKRDRNIRILVATSGDTGGAVALGFHNVPGIDVTILYPSGKVSPIQEKQLTTLGNNITALEIKGTFDDCQRMVKQAFLDEELNSVINLSSANSINIARLIPQTFYYFNAYAQLRRKSELPIVFSVPSGNFGNLTAGLLAHRMGLPVQHFIAATNVNDEVPEYLQSGFFTPRSTLHTLSNAMDVGNPSNFVRMKDLYQGDVEKMRKDISGYSFTDEATLSAIKDVYASSEYILCPHTAVANLGLKEWMKGHSGELVNGVFLSTAHPCKFPDVYDEEMLHDIELPKQVTDIAGREKKSVLMENDFEAFKNWLLAQ